jgi:adenosylmethionine-8-amino-7-oxononanoate aminotransferase
MDKDRSTCNIDCIVPLEKLLKEKSQEIAGIILEPLVQAAGGMIIYPKEYLLKAAEFSKRFNVHLIVDEVATGFGRTGKMFASEFVDCDPDFMCLSKGITSGYLPLAVTLTTDRIYKAFYADFGLRKTFYHGHTYTANPLSCSAALASLKIFEEERTLERIKKIIPLFSILFENFRDLPLVGDVRHIGLIGAIELVKDKKTKKSFNFKERVGLEVYKRSLKKNLILRPLGNIIYLFPPLCIKKDELEDIADRTYSIIKSL